VSKSRNQTLRNKASRIERRLERRSWSEQAKPMIKAGKIKYQIADRTRAMACGGLGLMQELAVKIKLRDDLDDSLHLLKRHLPYHESDHILSLVHNILSGGTCLEDLDLKRCDEVYLDAVGAHRIPDPTTAGDFLRRFKLVDIETLLDCINRARRRVWTAAGMVQLDEAFIDVDGTIAPTGAECSGGIGLSYKGEWGYAPLVISLGHTKEVLFVVNRPGNSVSHDGAAAWIDKAIDLVAPCAKRVCLRGDTDFSLTEHLDRWRERADFVFGVDAHEKLVTIAENLDETAWQALTRRTKRQVLTRQRRRPINIKEQIVVERKYKNIRLQSEQVAEFEYQPGKCQRPYRMIVLRKNLSIERGTEVLFPDIRYFFYITTRTDLTAAEVVWLANGRGDQENVIEQLKNGVNAMCLPANDLLSNWAYMVIGALAWNLKQWFGLLIPDAERSREVCGMEFRRFLLSFMLLPCQIIKQAGGIIYRLLGYNSWMKDLFSTHQRIGMLRVRWVT
jgi:hypothetical protein